jgi:PBP superfamily domain
MDRLLLRLLVLLAVAAAPARATVLNGAGATFPFPLYSKWVAEFSKEAPDVQINHQPIGSGGGIFRVELDGEAAYVARGIGRAALAHDRREAHEHRRALAHLGEGCGPGVLRDIGGALEVAVCPRSARVDDALRNALMVEVLDLVAKDEVLEERRPTKAHLE